MLETVNLNIEQLMNLILLMIITEPNIQMINHVNDISTEPKGKVMKVKISLEILSTRFTIWHIWEDAYKVIVVCLQLTSNLQLTQVWFYLLMHFYIVKKMTYCLFDLQIVVDFTIWWRKIFAIILKDLLWTSQMLKLLNYKLHCRFINYQQIVLFYCVKTSVTCSYWFYTHVNN